MGLTYRAPATGWSPGRGEIHLCLVPLVAPAACLEKFAATLEPEERARAARFRTRKLQDDFVIARGTLRAILGRCLQVPAAEVRFEYGANGKPRVAGQPALRFNLSHSGERALYAFARDFEIGVDIELERPLDDYEDLARRYFSAAEVRDLATLPEHERTAAFFTCWTRKEAYIKACGEGLSLPLDAFRVTLRPAEPPRLETPLDHRTWSLFDASPGAGYHAALAAHGRPTALHAWGYRDAEHCAGEKK